MNKKINEATSTDIPVITRLTAEYGWQTGDTLLYQQTYDISENLKKDYPNFKNIRPDIVLQDLNGEVLAVIENNLDKKHKDLLKLRTVVTQVLKPRFLYACSAERILFYDNEWRGLDVGDFRQVSGFMTLEEMKLKIEQQKKITSNAPIEIDTKIAGGFDDSIGKERFRCYKFGFDDLVMLVACGLHNFRISTKTKALLF
jgi:type I site-specific restriction endonuclease